MEELTQTPPIRGIDTTADTWSLGIIILEFVTGVSLTRLFNLTARKEYVQGRRRAPEPGENIDEKGNVQGWGCAGHTT